MNSDALRSVVEATAPQRVAFELRLGQSKPVYEAVKYLNNTPAVADQLSPEQRRLVLITLEDAMDSGVGLPPDKKKRFNEIVNILQKLTLNYSNNVLDATKVRNVLELYTKEQLSYQKAYIRRLLLSMHCYLILLVATANQLSSAKGADCGEASRLQCISMLHQYVVEP